MLRENFAGSGEYFISAIHGADINGSQPTNASSHLLTQSFPQLRIAEAHLTKPAELESAFDTALTQVRRSITVGMKTSDGSSAQPQLQQLERELKEQRTTALEQGRI